MYSEYQHITGYSRSAIISAELLAKSSVLRPELGTCVTHTTVCLLPVYTTNLHLYLHTHLPTYLLSLSEFQNISMMSRLECATQVCSAYYCLFQNS